MALAPPRTGCPRSSLGKPPPSAGSSRLTATARAGVVTLAEGHSVTSTPSRLLMLTPGSILMLMPSPLRVFHAAPTRAVFAVTLLDLEFVVGLAHVHCSFPRHLTRSVSPCSMRAKSSTVPAFNAALMSSLRGLTVTRVSQCTTPPARRPQHQARRAQLEPRREARSDHLCVRRCRERCVPRTPAAGRPPRRAASCARQAASPLTPSRQPRAHLRFQA